MSWHQTLSAYLGQAWDLQDGKRMLINTLVLGCKNAVQSWPSVQHALQGLPTCRRTAVHAALTGRLGHSKLQAGVVHVMPASRQWSTQGDAKVTDS